MQPQISTPTSTIRRYSLVVEAGEKERQANQTWASAYKAWIMNPTEETHRSFVNAANAREEARLNTIAATKKIFPK